MDTRVTGGPVWDEEDADRDPGPVVWQVDVHRGRPLDPPARLVLDAWTFADVLARDAGVVERWWPGGDPLSRAYDALRVGFDAALVGIDRTPHGFVLDRDDTLRLTTQHPCLDPVAHLDPDADVFVWSAYGPGSAEFEEELAEQRRGSRHRRHAGLVRAWLLTEADHRAIAQDDERLDGLLDALAGEG